MIPLPIDQHLPAIRDALRAHRAVVVVAEPGAGKTTRVPPALIADGRVILLQPRRVAARAITQRIAGERGWQVGREIGWQIRFEHRFTAATQLLVATEGILTARLQQDPLLSTFQTIVLDEFHERSLQADLGIALAKQAWLARDDLRIAVMSATIDAGAVAAFLGGCPVIAAPGRLHRVDVEYAPGESTAAAAADLLHRTTGDVLCFEPGAREIHSTMAALAPRVASDVDVIPLYGALDSEEQDRALAPGRRRRIVVATNIAETSVTVPGVTAVVDAGLHKVARYDAARGIDSLVAERITRDAADQRAGRAGRTRAGAVRRLWDARDRLRPHREAEIQRVDLASAALDVIAWGSDPRHFEWFEAPPSSAIDAAIGLLERLGAIEHGALTDTGRRMQRIPLHPRLSRMLVAVAAHRDIARACAVLSERQWLPPRTAATSSDLLSALDDWKRLPVHVQRVAADIEQIAARVLQDEPGAINRRGHRELGEEAFRRALLDGYPDRVAQRRQPASARVLIATGAGAVVGPESGVHDGEFILALDVSAPARPGEADSRVRMASRVERQWLEPTSIETVHRIDDAGVVRAAAVARYDALTLSERPVPVDAGIAAELLAAAYLNAPRSPEDERLVRRLAFAEIDADFDALVRLAAYGVRSVRDIRPEPMLDPQAAAALARDAPDTLNVPSGRRVRLEYGEGGAVSASVKLQELFGLAETPRVGRRGQPVLLALLAPSGRPVQLTRDLRSFWDRTYPEIRKELRGRYPKHPWPEDPWNAPPTSKTVSSRGKVRH